MNDEKLFTEFPPVTTEQWEATINKDLKGADYEKKLVWRTDEGFQVRPYYRAENLQDLDYLKTMPNEFPYTRGTNPHDNSWEIVQEVEEADPTKANAIAVDALKRGATCIAFNATNVDNAAALETLLKGIDLNVNGVQFNHVKNYLDLMKNFVAYVEKNNFDKEKVQGSINFDPLIYRLKHNKFWKSAEEDMQQALQLLEMNGCMKNFKVINVNGITLHNAGATIVQELAYTLNMANEYLAFCTEKGLKPEKVASRMQLTLSVGSNYFMEIAKLRAARLLWSTMVAQYKPACDCAYKIHINTVASTWNKTLYDPYVNMLRSTTEGMSAAIGGSDSISLQPFDVAYKESDEFSRRISRNVQVILKEEAFMDRVVDPAAGSYYVENLTNSIAENAWKLFQSVEQQGGALATLNILSGKINPSGKLSETLPVKYEDVASSDNFPSHKRTIEYREAYGVGYRYFEKAEVKPAFPFGFGLSYTTFEYKNLKVDEKGVSFEITNTGKVDGKEIAQLYIGLQGSGVIRPVKELKGFVKVFLKAGETKQVSIAFDDKTFRYFNVKTNKWEIEKGTYDIYVGASSDDIRLTATIFQKGTEAELPYDIKALPNYALGNLRNLPDQEFELLLGHPIPSGELPFYKKNRMVVDYNTTMRELRYSKRWVGRLVGKAIPWFTRVLIKFGNRELANTLIMGVVHQPMRGMSRFSNGGLRMSQLDGLIMMFNGHFWKGLHHFNKEGRKYKRIEKAEKKAAKQNQNA